MVVVLALVSMFGVGYSPQPQQEEAFRSVIRPVTDSERSASLPAAPDAATSTARFGEGKLDKGGKDKKLSALQPPPAPEETCDDLRVLVDQKHSLPADYVPEDLVSLWDHGVPTLGSDVPKLRSDAAEDLKVLVDAAAANGHELVVASAYRSYEDQRLSHARLASVYGEEGAHAVSATPGHSQHQLGTAVDFTNALAAYQVWEPFGQTGASSWLEVHAPEHGFVLAYPKGKERETGYRWEPWHYRYVGKANASRIERSGLSLQEFLEREGVSPRC